MYIDLGSIMNLIKKIPFRSGMIAAIISSVLVGCGSNDDSSTTPTEPTTPTVFQKQLKMAFPHTTSVFGIEVRGTVNTSSQSLLHAARVMAHYLDSDEDGIPDNKEVVAKLVEKSATLVIGATADDIDNVANEHFTEAALKAATLQDLYVSEMYPNGAETGKFDATLEEVLHLITSEGYADVYPEIFAGKFDSAVADAMDIARGGRYESIPDSYPESAWYTYDDESCDYRCMVDEYTYWSLTSILGAQSFDGRLAEIQDEWTLNTKVKVEQQDPSIFSILTNGSYTLPTVLPDGEYDIHDFTVTGITTDPKKTAVFDFITEQSADTIAVYGAKSINKDAYNRALTDVKEVISLLNSDVKQGLFNSNVKMLIVENEQALEDNIDYLMSLLPLEAVFTNNDGQDETLTSDENHGLSTTKLELMYLVVYYALLTESNLNEQYQQLKSAYNQAAAKGIFTPSEAYQDGYVDEIHQNASDKKALKYGSYLFNIVRLHFGNDQGVPGEFTITTSAELESQNPLAVSFIETLFTGETGGEGGDYQPATFTFKDNETNSTTVYMNGVINSDTLTVIKKLFADYPDVNTLVMQNVPGSMDDEINLLASREIRKQGIATHIPADGMVASGGTDMFLAGAVRTIEAGAKLGVHAWATDENEATDYPKNHQEHVKYLQYYQEMGIPSDFYWYTIEAASADDIHWMTENEITKYGVLTD